MFDVLEKVDQPLPSLESLKRMGVPAMDDAQAAGNDLATFLRQLMLVSGINIVRQVNDCETAADWTESDNGTFDVTVGSTGKRVGTNCLKLTATATCDGSQYVQTLLINGSTKVPAVGASSALRQQNWEDTRYLGFWIHNETNGDFSTAGEMKVTIVNDGVEQTQVNIQALVDDVHQWFEIDMEANSWNRDKVESLRFYANVASGEDLYIDDIIRYEISYDRGPLYGAAFPIKSGTTLTNNTHCKWTIDGLIAVTSSDVASLGVVKLFSNGAPVARTGTLTGDGARSKWGFFPGQFLYITRASAATVAGEGLEVAAAGTVAGVATGVDEKAHAKGLEAAGAANDDIFVLAGTDTSFIS